MSKTTTAAVSADLTTVQAELLTTNEQVKRAGTYADAIKAVKAAFAGDKRKLNALDKARAAMLDTRCEVIRATAWAMTFPESHAKSGTKAGQPSQSVLAAELGYNRLTFAPFFKAAAGLYAEFPELETQPGLAITEPEREYVSSFWKAEALRAKQRRDEAAAKAEKQQTPDGTDGEVEVIAPADKGTDVPTSVTADSVLGAMAALAKQLTDFAASKQGFTGEQAKTLMDGLTAAVTVVEGLKVTGK